MARKKNLIIVESPAKTRTLSSFLGKDYDVRASMGHVRDLPKSTLGVDPEEGFKPKYLVIQDRKTIIEDLKKAARSCDNVYLASDPDREGEAIAWHLAEVLKSPNIRRIQFNEITRGAVQEALKHPREINQSLVDAQQARRVLDRLVGYKLSPLLWKKVRRNLSAGRVQSVTVRLVVEREREIEAFVTREYWSLSARLTPLDREHLFTAKLHQVAGQKAEIADRGGASQITERLGYELVESEPGKWLANPRPGADRPEWKVVDVRRKEQRRNPAPPFITSTLQQEAARKLGLSARRTMQTAQQLYEGMELGGEGHVGLITYMRTDSMNVAAEARAAAKLFIESTWGSRYVAGEARTYKAKAGAQEAHEAIRPTDVSRTPEQLRGLLTSDQYRLYNLIWQRFLASQMAAIIFDVTTLDVEVLDLLFRATGRIVRFDGFSVLYQEGRDDVSREQQDEQEEEGMSLPDVQPGARVADRELAPRQHFTEPPPRYSEASLVRALEERGIGRPSTYAQILSTIVDREYVTIEERRFRPTDLGRLVNDYLVSRFPEVLDSTFTASVEQHLDDIADGDRQWIDVLQEFYEPFQASLAEAEQQGERVRPAAEETDVPCQVCGKNMVIRSSRYGRFLGCSAYPECKTTQPLPDEMGPEVVARSLEEVLGPEGAAAARKIYESVPEPVLRQHARLGVLAARDIAGDPPAAGSDGAEAAGAPVAIPDCKECGRPMQKRSGRFGEFWGCTGYPECKAIFDPRRSTLPPPDPEFSMPCPRPECAGTVTAKRSRRGKVFYGCSNYSADPACDYVAWNRPLVDQPCPDCGYPQTERTGKTASGGLKCTNAGCPKSGAKPGAAAGKKTTGRGRSTGAARKSRATTGRAARSEQ